MTRLEGIRERLGAATPGPWYFDSGNGNVESHHEDFYRDSICERADLSEKIEWAKQFGRFPPDQVKDAWDDCEFIANSRADIEYLIDLVRKKDELISDVRSEMTQIYGITDPEWCRDTLSEALALTEEE